MDDRLSAGAAGSSLETTRAGRSTSEFRRFVLVGTVVALGFVWVISVGLARVAVPRDRHCTQRANDICTLIGVLAPAVTSFIGHRFFTFAPKVTGVSQA